MPSKYVLSSQIFALGFFGLTLLPGAWMFATTPVSGLGKDIIQGTVQRHYETRFEDNFPMQRAVRQAWNAVKFGALGEMAEGAFAGRGGVLFTAEEFTVPSTTDDFSYALAEARSRIEEAGAELIPVIIPDKARMMPQALPRGRSAKFEHRYDGLLDYLARNGLRSIDLRPALGTPGSFMITDTHWSPRGARAVAAAIGNLLAMDIVANSSFETVQIGTRPFDGDLLVFADTGPWRKWIGPAFEEIATYETHAPEASALGLFDDVATPIVLVGTSFSARKDFHFSGFLKSELKADVVSYAIEGRGPFIPMDAFLDSTALKENSPQFVIWEIPERYLNTWSLDQ